MSRPIRQIAAGSRVFFRLEVRDLTDDAQPLMTPANAPTLELRDPNGVVKINYLATTEGETGVFTYTYQTATTDTIGVWRVKFKITDGSDIDYTIGADAFELVP